MTKPHLDRIERQQRFPAECSIKGSYQHIALVYRYLAQCFSFPHPSWFTPVFFQTLLDLLDTLEADEEAQALGASFANSTTILEEVQIDYTRLFITAVPHTIAPPYASVYLDGMLQGPHVSRIVSCYRRKGFCFDHHAELPDSLVSQLEFLGHLSATADHVEERSFLQEHFRTWFPMFRDRVRTGAHHPYYRVVVDMTDYFTKEEH